METNDSGTAGLKASRTFWSAEQKQRIVAGAETVGANVADVAKRHGVLNDARWRKRTRMHHFRVDRCSTGNSKIKIVPPGRVCGSIRPTRLLFFSSNGPQSCVIPDNKVRSLRTQGATHGSVAGCLRQLQQISHLLLKALSGPLVGEPHRQGA